MRVWLVVLLSVVSLHGAVQDWDGACYDNQSYKQKASAHRLLQEIDLQHCKAIADLGCGTGDITAWIAANSDGEVVGYDFSESMIGVARRKYGHIPNLSFEVLDARDWCCEAERFDAIFAFSMLHWIDDIGAVLKKLAISLKPGGVFAAVKAHVGHFFYEPLIQTTQAKKWRTHFTQPDVQPWHAHTPLEFTELLRSAGLAPIQEYSWYKESVYSNAGQLVDWLMGWVTATPQLQHLPKELKRDFVKDAVDAFLPNRFFRQDGSVETVSPVLMIYATREI